MTLMTVGKNDSIYRLGQVKRPKQFIGEVYTKATKKFSA